MLAAVTPDALVPKSHPIRRIMPMVDRALAQPSPTFDRMYADKGRASIPPEHLLKACLLMALYSVRSERQFCEQLVSRVEQKRTTGLSTFSESVLANWLAEMSNSPHGEGDFESKRTGKTSGSEQFAR